MQSIPTETTYTKTPGSAAVATTWDIGVALDAHSMATTDTGAALLVPRQGRVTTFGKLGPEPPRPSSERDLEGGYLELRRNDNGINHSQSEE